MHGGQTHVWVVESGVYTMVSSGVLAPMPDGQPSSAGACKDDEEEMLATKGAVSPFLHCIGLVRAFLQLSSPEALCSFQLMGIEWAKGSVLPSHTPVTLPWLLMAEAVCEEVQLWALNEPKLC